MLAKSQETTPHAFYFGRYKGNYNCSPLFFVIYETAEVKRWWCEVPERVSTPEEMIEKVVEHEESNGKTVTLLAAGTISEQAVNFIHLKVSPDEIKEVVIASFSNSDNLRKLVYRYAEARIIIQSMDSGWGTIESLLDEYGLQIPE